MKRVGLYGGSFDPIHFGHLNLALGLLEHWKLDEVLFCPAHTPPHRVDLAASAEQRLQMVKLAVEPISQFRVLDFEVQRGGRSFTVETLRALKEGIIGFSFDELFLLMSDESAAHLHLWKDPEEIVRLATPLVGRRFFQAIQPPKTGNSMIDLLLARGYTNTSVFEVSGTEIRARMRQGLYCGHLIPQPALQYAEIHHLYDMAC